MLVQRSFERVMSLPSASHEDLEQLNAALDADLDLAQGSCWHLCEEEC